MTTFKCVIAVVGVVLLMIGSVLPAEAELRLTAKGGLHSFEKDGYSAEDTAIAYGFGISYLPPIKDQIMDLTFEYLHGKVQSYVGNNSNFSCCFTPSGRSVTRIVTWDAFSFGAHYRPPVSTSVQPYIGGGIGIYVFNPREKGGSCVNCFPLGARVVLNGPVQVRQGFHLDLGTDFVVAPHWIVGLEYKHVFANVSSDSNDATAAWTNNLSFGALFGNLRYAF